MLTEICANLKNYFDYERHIGKIEIADGVITCNGERIETGQHFALFRDNFALGVYKAGDALPDKTFDGAVWLMDIPQAVLAADTWAEEWNAKNGTAAANGPFQSESFGGYSYTKGSSTTGGVGSGVFDQAQMKAMLAPYKKIRL